MDIDFFYKKGDADVTAMAYSRPVPQFYSLTEILKDLYKQAKIQLARYHAYIAADSVMGNAPKSTTPCSINNVFIKLPSLEMDTNYDNIRISNDTGENIIFIDCSPNQQIHLVNSSNKDLITIQNTDTLLSIIVFGLTSSLFWSCCLLAVPAVTPSISPMVKLLT
jgi:hypothetical protein